MQSINKAFLLIGGNLGNMFLHFHQAVEMLNGHCGKIIKKSAIYQTAAWGKPDQPPFLNQALLLETSFTADELMPRLLDIEEKMGRKRMEKYGPRLIDIDILLFNDEVHHSEAVTVPHPEMQNRMFALVPLAEIASNELHPILKKTIAELVLNCRDELEVKKVDR